MRHRAGLSGGLGAFWRLAVTVALILLASGLTLVLAHPGARDAGHRAVDTAWPGWGFTHTQYSADDGVAGAVSAVAQQLKSVPLIQAQHIMGFGADNPEPAPGVFSFESLDRRMAFIRQSGGIPVIVLCCAPDWMKGGAAGATDWSRLEAAPLREHFADFAALSAAVARRYPDVRHFVVWNEFKGFFDDAKKRWDAASYTDMYNLVYRAVKAVNPEALIGGPYLDFAHPFDITHAAPALRGAWGAVDQRVLDAFAFWKMHRVGADFVVVDGHGSLSEGATDEFAAIRKFSAVSAWLRKQTDLPIWWAEWYVEADHPGWSAQHSVALRVAAMIELAATKPQAVLYWNPKPADQLCETCLWSDTWSADGGRALPFLTDVVQRFAREFPPAVDRCKIQLAQGISALRSPDAMVVVNTTGESVDVDVDGTAFSIAPYDVAWFDMARTS